ncbi:hypothetical protein, partial [Porphyromonas sp.]|uniref:hypothetical protein n=1 Tax=Porphyromonas sp. TaxID=1924944 RepID=UPI003A94B84E
MTYIRVPKRVPLLGLFGSNGGVRNFQRWKIKFPREEIYFSNAGKFLGTCGGVTFATELHPYSSTFVFVTVHLYLMKKKLIRIILSALLLIGAYIVERT